MPTPTLDAPRAKRRSLSPRALAALSLAPLVVAACHGGSSEETLTAPPPEATTAEVTQAASGTCITIQRGGAGSVADALLNSGQPDRNFGATGSLTAGMSSGTQRQGLVKFDLSMLLPGTTVTSATLNLNAYLPSGTAKPVRIHRALSPWVESTVTWNTFGGSFASAVEAQIQPAAAFTWTATDVTALVAQWVSGAAPNHGMLLERDLDGSTVYGTSESPQLPSLQVCYVPPFCQGKANGTACDDGNACTTGDTCQGQVCAGSAITCAAPDQCHTGGACNPSTGQCAPVAKADGTACDDGDLCTTGDVCTAGVCGGAAVSCTAPDQCHTGGTCNPSTGQCAPAAKADGTACDDGDLCTTGDVCTAGVCGGAPLVCPGAGVCQVGACDATSGQCILVDASDPADGVACSTGLPGVCAAGLTQCTGSTLVCNQTTASSAEVCNGLDDDCNGAVDDGAAASCPAPAHASATCAAGSCGFSCDAGYGNCDGSASNGCETALNVNGNCGGCGVTCGTGVCNGGTCGTGASCYAIKTANPSAASGVYTIDPDGAGGNAPFSVYCDMTRHGGGWTLVGKIGESATANSAFDTDASTAGLTNPVPASSEYSHWNLARFNGFGSTWTVRSATDVNNNQSYFQYVFFRPKAGATPNPGLVGQNWNGTSTYNLLQYLTKTDTQGLANTTWLPMLSCSGGHCGYAYNLFTYRDPNSGAQCLSTTGQTQNCHAIQGGVSQQGGTMTAAFGMQDGVAHGWGRKGTYWIRETNVGGTP